MARRISREYAALEVPPARCGFLRADQRTWRQAVAIAFDVLRNPDARPEAVRDAVAEMTLLATAADECAAEVKAELNQV